MIETSPASVGQPSAARAIGQAVGRNAIAWLIPCHRVIRATGVITQYRWGAARKEAMLAWEVAQTRRA
ncbi:MAG: MGMT family protein [Alphaproteobacteria bacterium]|nr:MGMT family protein [Alphaproteobacteria bacterium]